MDKNSNEIKRLFYLEPNQFQHIIMKQYNDNARLAKQNEKMQNATKSKSFISKIFNFNKTKSNNNNK